MTRVSHLVIPAVIVAMVALACGGKKPAAVEPAILMDYPIASADGVLDRTHAVFDSVTTDDGNGSLRITAEAPVTVRLFETGDVDVENARLVYRARLRTADVEGNVYLEMWCSFAGKGEFFSRALQTPLSGTVEWSSQETPFFLKAGENPDNVKLNLVVNGTGTVWIDRVQLVKGPPGNSQ